MLSAVSQQIQMIQESLKEHGKHIVASECYTLGEGRWAGRLASRVLFSHFFCQGWPPSTFF